MFQSPLGPEAAPPQKTNKGDEPYPSWKIIEFHTIAQMPYTGFPDVVVSRHLLSPNRIYCGKRDREYVGGKPRSRKNRSGYEKDDPSLFNDLDRHSDRRG